MSPNQLITLIEQYALATGLSPGYVGKLCSGSGDFYHRIKADHDITNRRSTTITQKLSDHWPMGQIWPPDIPRPAPALDSPAAEAIVAARQADPLTALNEQGTIADPAAFCDALYIDRTTYDQVIVAGHERQLQTAQYLPGLHKQWRRSGKVHSRLQHDLADGQIRPVDEPFLVGGYALMYPRDLRAPAKHTINSGCDSLPWMEHWDLNRVCFVFYKKFKGRICLLETNPNASLPFLERASRGVYLYPGAEKSPAGLLDLGKTPGSGCKSRMNPVPSASFSSWTFRQRV